MPLYTVLLVENLPLIRVCLAEIFLADLRFSYTDNNRSSRLSELIKEIIFETIEIGKRCGDPVEELYYVGYNFEGQKLFQYIATSVNVHFEV